MTVHSALYTAKALADERTVSDHEWTAFSEKAFVPREGQEHDPTKCWKCWSPLVRIEVILPEGKRGASRPACSNYEHCGVPQIVASALLVLLPLGEGHLDEFGRIHR